MNKFSGMYSNLAQQECVFTSDACNEVVSTFLVTNEYICHTENSFYTLTYDANGNRTEYVSANGNVVAQYQYSAFGEIISQSGESFTHRFSTKPYCPTTGLIEYQFRKYDPALGRWLSRDPIEEAGGINLYAFCGNSIMGVDVLGLTEDYRFEFCDGFSMFLATTIGVKNISLSGYALLELKKDFEKKTKNNTDGAFNFLFEDIYRILNSSQCCEIKSEFF